MRRLKGSTRGITFSTNKVNIGDRFRYFVDIKDKTVSIIPDVNGSIVASKKKSGKNIKALFDLRSKEVKELIRNSAYMEIEEKEGSFVIHVYAKAANKICLFRKNRILLDEILGEETGKIIVPYKMLQEAIGSTVRYEKSIFSDEAYFKYLQSTVPTFTKYPAKEKLKKIYDVVSLFSGAGLFDKAWLDGGRFRFVYANDFCKDVIETYEHNIGSHIVCKDIRDVQPQEIPFSDLFVASPCCQAFSNANRHNMRTEEAEQKRLLIEEVGRLADAKKPKVVVIENVPQLLTKENGLYVKSFMDSLPGYEFTAQVITDSEVGGYSERKRCIIIASRIGKIEFPKLTVVTPKTVKEALAKVDMTWFNYDDITIPSEKTQTKMSYVKPGGNWKDIPSEIGGYGPNTQSNIMRRLDPDKPSITLSNFRKSNILHPFENRILSVSEAAAIMGLERDFRFISDSLSAKQQMVANGVTQAIGKFVKNVVLKKLDEFTYGKSKTSKVVFV